MFKKFKIGKNFIGENNPVYIIAEAGVNHNGKISLAIKLVDEAKKIGASAIKFQTFTASDIVTPSAKKAQYQLRMKDKNYSQFKMLKKLELSKKDFYEIKKYCERKKIEFLSTPYSYKDIDFLTKIKVNAFKTSSMNLPEDPFIDYISKLQKPLLVSTGMSNFEEVKRAFKIIKKNKNYKLVLFQCTSAYPSSIKDSNLSVIKKYSEKFKSVLGYSDHTHGSLSACLSIGFGVKVVEKHFTLSNKMNGPDHLASLDVKNFKSFIDQIRLTESALGKGIKKVMRSEFEMRKKMRRSIFASTHIERNGIISLNNVVFKRPGTGLPPKYLKKILGKKVKKSLNKNNYIHLKDLK